MTAQYACDVSDLGPEEVKAIDLTAADGSVVEVAVVRDSEGGWHAINDVCTHGAVNLSDGEVEGCLIECWLHGSTFDLNSGEPTTPPASSPVDVYPVTISGEQVLVDVDGN
ncbi:non-heme iron oxygenase ferredoxin subunit [Rarobacter faecitabidus]|uniref:3-phenylpropionate/trans-cinnamate dioxygenase ferredoxin subunit n=1 Tax=Rarobacter faecitabidus TaxID=13243 RepID=A0A542ZVH2_RARFA|nr:non-heme iron oxygenase ferredoxin subunit [Rarobacter faecitabidus]TQL64299.1 3-phenylpropionate/trans-cinnamate dioxygenase ferredoxin subunit [Rarobacter faecitabidus]